MNINLRGISKSYFINLDRRTDRLHHVLINTPFFTERFSAIDSRQMQLTDEVKKLFPKTWQKRTKAEICCAISHYRLWKKLIADCDAKNYLILEDDTVFEPGFENFWNQVYSDHIPENAFLIYLGGCQPWNKPEYHKVLQRHNDYFYTVKKNDYFTKDDHFWHMNANSYILSKQAANLMCQWVDQFGMDQALDNFMQNFFNENKLFAAPELVFHLNPLMSHQLHEENDNIEIDKKSDLRYAEEKFVNVEGVSVVIPTVWAANDYMMKSLLLLDKVECVEEVIVIDNDKTKTPHWIQAFQKVKLIDPGKRMYFNESVNFGIDLCKNDICCIYNDDITSDTRVFDYVRNNLTKEDGCIFISPEYINKNSQSNGKLKKANNILADGLHRGSGMMMFLRKQNFIKIPSELIHHFGDTFIFEINKRQGKQNYIVEGFPIETPGSASQDESVEKVIAGDWKIHKKVFCNLNTYLNKEISFPRLTSISKKEIPKKIHLSWKNKNILDSNYSLIRKGAKNLELLNSDWDIEVNDDEDVNRYIRDNIGRSSWRLIKDRKITEKTDLWRLLKIYKEGGLYVDIDRYIDTPLSEIIQSRTSCVIPTFQDIDFSQDFVLSCADNPMMGRAISNNLFNRKDGRNLFYTAICSYMHAASEFLSGARVERGDNPEYFNDIRRKIDECEYLETYREIGPEYHTLFRNIDKQFNSQTFEKDKADFYNEERVIHWNTQTRAFHVSQKTKKNNARSEPGQDKEIDPQKHKEFLKLKNEWSNLVDRDCFKYISKHLNQIQVPREKFTTYNPGGKIAIVSLYTPEISDYAICSEMSVRDYCLKQGYTFYVYREKLQDDASANWSKARAILNHFDDHEDIVWMDSDTIIYNPEKRFEDILARCTGTKKIIACEDIGASNKKIAKGMMLNSGVVIFRNHSYTKNLIKKWMNADCDKSSLYASGGDQGMLCDILKKSDGFGFNRKIFPMNEFNTEPRFVDENTFILHFMAYPYELKKIFMRYFVSD